MRSQKDPTRRDLVGDQPGHPRNGYYIPVQVFSRISEGSTHGKHGRFPKGDFPKGPYILSAGTFLGAMCQACLGHIHAERLRFPD